MLGLHQKLAEAQLRDFQAVVYVTPLLWGPVAVSLVQSPAAGSGAASPISWQTD